MLLIQWLNSRGWSEELSLMKPYLVEDFITQPVAPRSRTDLRPPSERPGDVTVGHPEIARFVAMSMSEPIVQSQLSVRK